MREYLVSAGTQYNCQGGINGDNPSEPALSDFSALNSKLDTANAMKFVGGKLGEDRFGSNPIRSAYFLLAHTLLEATFDQVQNFTSTWNYPNLADTLYSEYGTIGNFRILTSSNSSFVEGASMNGRRVYQNVFSGHQGYAHILQNGYSMQLLYRPAIYSGPMALNSTLAIKFAQAQTILQDTWCGVMRCTAAA